MSGQGRRRGDTGAPVAASQNRDGHPVLVGDPNTLGHILDALRAHDARRLLVSWKRQQGDPLSCALLAQSSSRATAHR